MPLKHHWQLCVIYNISYTKLCSAHVRYTTSRMIWYILPTLIPSFVRPWRTVSYFKGHSTLIKFVHELSLLVTVLLEKSKQFWIRVCSSIALCIGLFANRKVFFAHWTFRIVAQPKMLSHNNACQNFDCRFSESQLRRHAEH